MPIASAGNVISASSQLGANVVLTGAIKDGEIVNADISASAAILGSKLQVLSAGVNAGVIGSGGIVNADINAGAAITDGKLATISTASKVDGAALYNLGNIPAGAGTIPAANAPAAAYPTATAGTHIVAKSEAETTGGTTTSYTLIKEITMGKTGTFTISFELKNQAGQTAYGKIYKNGSAVGTERINSSNSYVNYDENLAFVAGDLIQIYGHNSSAGLSVAVDKFRIKEVAWQGAD